MEIVEYVADPVKWCQKCDSLMHYCHEQRQSGRTQGGQYYKGCGAKQTGMHPAENCFVCLFCLEKVDA